MQKMIVTDVNGKLIFEGTKQECKHHIKRHMYHQGTYRLLDQVGHTQGPAVYQTTGLTEPKTPGFLKRIFGNG